MPAVCQGTPGPFGFKRSLYQFIQLTMFILGINAYHADSSAAIFKDGRLIAATEEERFRRVKHWAGFPAQAISFCLNEAGLKLADIDHVAINQDGRANLFRK